MSEFHRIRTILRDYGDLFGDVGDLLRKQLRLAEGELKLGLANLTQAVVLFVATGIIALFAVLLLLIGFVHLIASFGLALHWSYILVALALLIIAGIIFYMARAKATAENLIPKRAFAQLGETARTLKQTIV
jgi:hypothetical protein